MTSLTLNLCRHRGTMLRGGPLLETLNNFFNKGPPIFILHSAPQIDPGLPCPSHHVSIQQKLIEHLLCALPQIAHEQTPRKPQSNNIKL